jgi:hypothetical protein
MVQLTPAGRGFCAAAVLVQCTAALLLQAVQSLPGRQGAKLQATAHRCRKLKTVAIRHGGAADPP